jgi:hypothetical protein
LDQKGCHFTLNYWLEDGVRRLLERELLGMDDDAQDRRRSSPRRRPACG